MADKGISSIFNVSGGSGSSEVNTYQIFLDGDLAQDISDLTRQTPFDLLIASERDDVDNEEYLELRREVVSRLLSYIFAPIKNMLPSPHETCVRLWLLCYLVSPQLINGMSLSEIGKLLGKLSRQLLSARLTKMSSSLGVRSRNQKSDSARTKYRELGKSRWKLQKRQQRQEKRAAYMKAYREKHSDKVRSMNAEYYAKNGERILASRTKKRRRDA